MRAIVCHEFGFPDNLEVSEVQEPEVGPDDVAVSVRAIGLGYVDALMVAGRYQIKPGLPFIPGNAGIPLTHIGNRIPVTLAEVD